MDKKQFHFRITGVVMLLLAVLLAFTWVLYNLQVVNGAEYRAKSQRKIANSETVEAARGEILDRYGRVLVSNRTSFNVSLDTSLMGERKMEILTQLLAISRAQGITWADSLPVSPAAPYFYTVASASDLAYSRFVKFLNTMDWWVDALPAGVGAPKARLSAMRGTPESEDENGVLTPAVPPTQAESAQPLIDKLRTEWKLSEELSDSEARALLGVLYELNLRSGGVTNVEYVFTQDVDINFITAVKEAGLAGVRIDPSTVREYHTPYAAHLLGRVGLMNETELATYTSLGYSGDAQVGKDGVEQAFESYLHGVEGSRYYETNTQGKIVNEYWATDSSTGEPLAPQPGSNVSLTLDIRLQEVVERSLAQRIPELPSKEAQGGAAVVIDVRDGGILAMGSYPTYDITQFSTQFSQLQSDPLKPLFNRATQGLYPPGSAFKMVVATGALQEGIITTKDKIKCTGIYTHYKNKADQPKCWIYRQFRGTHGILSVTEAIEKSCNIFFYDTGRRLGIEKIDEYARKFGLGEKTGIEIYEETGHIAGPDYTTSLGQTWYDGNVMYAAIGQENNQFTPLQLANYMATLVNGGTHYSAHLLHSVKSNDFSEVLVQNDGEAMDTIEIDPENLAAIKQGMYDAAQNVPALRNLDIKTGAKTGSAQVSSASQSNAVFVCFAPYDDPQIAIAITVEKGGSGAELGAIAADIIEYYFGSNNSMDVVEQENTLLR